MNFKHDHRSVLKWNRYSSYDDFHVGFNPPLNYVQVQMFQTFIISNKKKKNSHPPKHFWTIFFHLKFFFVVCLRYLKLIFIFGDHFSCRFSFEVFLLNLTRCFGFIWWIYRFALMSFYSLTRVLSSFSREFICT